MITPDLWRKSGQWLTVNGRRLFIKAVGQGPPLFMLHAFPTSSYDYSRLVPLLADHYRLLLFDYPGYGFSDKPYRHAYSLFEYADCLGVVAAHFGIRRVFVLAHDIGDSVALITLLRQTPVIEKLILLNGSVVSIPFTDLVMRATQRVLLNRTLGAWIGRIGLINQRFFATTAKKLFSQPLPDAEFAAFWSIITYNKGNRLYPILMRYMLERWQYQYQWLEVLKQNLVPLTLIWGEVDPIATPAVADAIVTYRPDAVDLRLPNVGHYPHWETPETVANAVREALG